MKSKKEKKNKQPMSLARKIAYSILGIAVLLAASYLLYYVVHYLCYDKYKDYRTDYAYEEGTAFTPVSEAKADVSGMVLVSENEYLKLYTDTATANVAVYDKRDGSVTYSNPTDPESDSIANTSNLNYLKSQFILGYYNADVKAGTYDSYSCCVAKGQYSYEGIENGIRYLYRIGDLKNSDGTEGISFEIPLEYRLKGDGIEVSIPVKGIKEYGNGYVYRIQLLRYMGAADNTEEGYMVVPNGSGSLIYFNNGKLSAASYSQYVYDLDPLAATYTTTENVRAARLPLYGICRQDRSLLVTVEDGASISLITAGISGIYTDYNYAYPTFILRNADNLRNFGDSTSDIYVMEPETYDVNLTVRYTFLTEEDKGYDGLAGYYRERLIAEGALEKNQAEGDIPFYYDVISGVKEYDHFLGVQYLHTFSMTTFAEAGEMSDALAAEGISNQVMNLQGWFNGGYYHDAPDHIRVLAKLGGKSGLQKLNQKLAENGGVLYADVAIQQVTFADDSFNYEAESSRYYGAGYAAVLGQVNPTTLRNTSGMNYMETRYNLLSPKFLSRYAGKLAKKIEKYDLYGISLRDLGSDLYSDKRRTEEIDRETALDVVLAQFELLEGTGKKLMTNMANAYSFAYSTDILNAPTQDNDFAIIDAQIPLYEMILHGCISYSSELINYVDEEDLTPTILNLIEAGASPHFQFTWEESSKMKDTGLNRFYATTFANWKDEAVTVYNQVNGALKYVNGALMTGHEILDNGVRKVSYDNGVVIYINYENESREADGLQIPAAGYRLEGI